MESFESAALYLFSDGGSRNNPGPAGIAFVIKDKSGRVLEKKAEFIGLATNNTAEYAALLAGLKAVRKYRPRSVFCSLDSQLVVNQLKGLYRIKKEHLRKFIARIRVLEAAFPRVEYKFVPREGNKEADELVNEVIEASLKSSYV